MRLLPAGSHGLLVELPSLERVHALYARLVADPPPGVLDVVPAARTVLLALTPDADRVTVVSAVRTAAAGGSGVPREVPDGDPVEIPVRYDGPDLDAAAGLLGWTVDELVTRHQTEKWTVAFCGFAPGFGYLTGRQFDWDVPRRERPRVRVPAGAVALAGGYAGVYPRESPGGWQVIGSSGVRLVDLDRDPPSLLRPGVRVRFTAEAT